MWFFLVACLLVYLFDFFFFFLPRCYVYYFFVSVVLFCLLVCVFKGSIIYTYRDMCYAYRVFPHGPMVFLHIRFIPISQH